MAPTGSASRYTAEAEAALERATSEGSTVVGTKNEPGRVFGAEATSSRVV
jgi:hypothetical protein